MSKTLPAKSKSPEKSFHHLDLSEEDLLCDQLNGMEIIMDHDESVPTSPATKKRNKGLVEYVRTKSGLLVSGIGRVSGNLLNKLVSAGMQTPLVKYLLSPNTLRRALNNDPVLRETYRIILTSEPVQALMTPEAMKIILDSETAKALITPEMVLTILNHNSVAQFATPEVVKFIVESEIIQNILRPESILNNMESRAVTKFLKPEIIHEIAYSQVFTRLMDPDFFVKWLSTSGVKDVMTKAAIEDALLCPGSIRTMRPETAEKVFGLPGVQNLLDHPGFYAHLLDVFEAVKTTSKQNQAV